MMLRARTLVRRGLLDGGQGPADQSRPGGRGTAASWPNEFERRKVDDGSASANLIIKLHGGTPHLEDYEGGVPRWCSDAGQKRSSRPVQRLCRDENLAPERTVFVSGIGCSSRFPHYMKTYGFHGIHGRAFPSHEGVKWRART